MGKWLKNKDGYTIVEVMIVLAVAGMLLASALAVFRGTGQKTQFEQAVNDFSSKLSSSIKAISNEVFPETDRYQCWAGPVLTKLTNKTQEQNTNQDCIYLGKVIQFTAQQNQMRIYTVLGNRLCDGSNACDSGNLASAFLDTDPKLANEAAGQPLTSDDLTETYTLSSSNMLLDWIHVNDDPTNNSEVAGFYNGIGADAASSATNGALNLLEESYSITGSSKTATGGLTTSQIRDCIQQKSGTCVATPLKSWAFCFKGTNDPTLRGLVTLTTSSDGASTAVKMRGC